MTSSNPTPKGKGSGALGALTDFLILVLLVGGAGFGGYYWGTTQRMAPVQMVPPGTPGAIPADKTQVSPPISNFKTEATGTKSGPAGTAISVTGDSNTTTKTGTGASSTTSTPAAGGATSTQPAANTTKSGSTETPKKAGPTKYWIVSTGSEYIGYIITVKVNGTPVDNFYGPGKTLNITHLVKQGENEITFDAKHEAKYNKHKDDEKAELKLELVSGPVVQEEFDRSAVLETYKRNAAETENFNDTEHFVKE